MIFVHNTPTNRLLNMVLGGDSPVVEYTATDNPLVFFTDLARPLKSLLIPFTPQQEGTGDPSPQNIRSILPWNGLKVWNGGKNLFKLVESEMVSVGWNRFFPNPIKKAGTYTISCQHPFGGTGNQGARVVLTNDDDSSAQEIKLLTAWTFGQSSAGSKATFTLTEEEAQCEYIWFQCAGANTGFNQFENAELQIEVGQTPTAYEPYKPITETDISFPSPVYGGEHEAVSGKLMDGWAKVEIKNCYYIGTWDGSKGAYWYITLGVDVVAPKKKAGSGLGMCESLLPVSNVSTEETRDVIAIFDNNIVKWIDTEHMTLTRQEYREYLANNPIVICYQIATPTEQTLTGHQITALVGKNTIWSDADGSMTIEYPADTKTYINNLIATAIASL